MVDAPVTDPTTPAAEPPAGAPVTAPPGGSQVGAPAVTPTPPPPAAAPEIPAETQFWVAKKDGSGEELVTLQQMADKYAERGSLPELDPEKLKQFELYNKAATGDRDAMLALVDKNLPKPPEPETTPANEEVAAIRKEMEDLKATVTRGEPLLRQIDDLRERSTLKTLIDSNVTAIPFLSRHPQAAQLLQERINKMSEMARPLGVENLKEQLFANFQNPRIREVWGQAFAAVEQELRATAEVYSGFDPAKPVPAANAPNTPVYVDDQGAEGPKAGETVPARFRSEGGQLVDNRGAAVAQTPWGTMENVPDGALTAPPSGVNPAAALQSQEWANSRPPRNQEELIAWMRERRKQRSEA